MLLGTVEGETEVGKGAGSLGTEIGMVGGRGQEIRAELRRKDQHLQGEMCPYDMWNISQV